MGPTSAAPGGQGRRPAAYCPPPREFRCIPEDEGSVVDRNLCDEAGLKGVTQKRARFGERESYGKIPGITRPGSTENRQGAPPIAAGRTARNLGKRTGRPGIHRRRKKFGANDPMNGSYGPV